MLSRLRPHRHVLRGSNKVSSHYSASPNYCLKRHSWIPYHMSASYSCSGLRSQRGLLVSAMATAVVICTAVLSGRHAPRRQSDSSMAAHGHTPNAPYGRCLQMDSHVVVHIAHGYFSRLDIICTEVTLICTAGCWMMIDRTLKRLLTPNRTYSYNVVLYWLPYCNVL